MVEKAVIVFAKMQQRPISKQRVDSIDQQCLLAVDSENPAIEFRNRNEKVVKT